MAWYHNFTNTPSPESVDFTGLDLTRGIDGEIPSNVWLSWEIPNIATAGGCYFSQKPDAPYTIDKSQTHMIRFKTYGSSINRFARFRYDEESDTFLNLGCSQADLTLASDLEWFIYMTENVDVDIDVVQTYTNCHSDFTSATIPQYEPLTINIYPDTGYDLKIAPTCTMGDSIIEPIAIDGGYQISIESVTNTVTISANGSEANLANYGFINIYNPTLFELQQASEKWFYSMSAGSYVDLSNYIVSLFITYGKPSVMTATETIKFSGYDTTIATHVVRQPIIEIDCGTITVNELHQNALDYSPNSSVRIFLPFIGFENLDIDIIMNCSVSLKYRIDVLTGKCIAKIMCEKNSVTYDIYTFTGDCSMQIPYFFNDGNTTNNSLVNRPYNLDDKTPFLLIERAVPYMPESSQLDGTISNELAILGELTGYTKCKEVNVYGVNCTSIEKDEIESLLKKGVIL